MTLRTGSRLGHYEITGALGAGGMGEVYKAKDTRLDRTVAIKVLPERLSANAELRQRFEQEARAVSSLNHPHICTLYDIGRDDGVDFMVMEYIEGETLADRLAKGPLSVDEALTYGIEVADALHQAHRRGVVHRDVKPGNIIITKAGTKLLDFGLARTTVSAQLGEDGSHIATEAKPLTQEGTILGTFRYMAPEQLEGQETDARTDIFAFGAVLYEMLTGKRAFEGKSQASLITAIMSAEPPAPSSLRPLMPKQIDDAIARCLAKDPDARWQSAADLAWELARVTNAEPTVEGRAASAKLPWLVAALAGVAALVCLGLWLSSGTPASTRMIQSTILPPHSVRYSRGFALSPDGRTIVFSMVDADGHAVLGARPLEGTDTRVLDGTERGSYPFWSPDSKNIGFIADGRVKGISVEGGPAQTLGAAPVGGWFVGTWSERGVILFASGVGPIYRIPETGGTPSPVTVVDEDAGELAHYSPYFLPDGNHFLYRKNFETSAPGDSSEVYVTSLDEPRSSRVVARAHPLALFKAVQYVDPGYLLFLDDDRTLTAQRFDPRRLELDGPRSPIARNVANPEGYVSLSVASNGTLVYRGTKPGETSGKLRWRARNGDVLGEVAATWTFGLSPDGRRVAFWQEGLQLKTFGRAVPARLGSRELEIEPVFSPDGRFVTYQRFGEEGLRLIHRTVDAEEERLLPLPGVDDVYPSGWSPDGSSIALSVPNPERAGSFDVWIYSIEEQTAEPFVSTEANERAGVFSPDGLWLAYQSDETGEYNIYVRPLSGSGVSSKLSPSGGLYPEWRQDGKELYYMRLDGTIMAVALDDETGYSQPVELFQIALPRTETFDVFDVVPDGERFLVLEWDGPPEPLTLVQNWPALSSP